MLGQRSPGDGGRQLLAVPAHATDQHRTGTEDLELVTSVLILPLYQPLHVAQRTAMLGNISGERLSLGVGYVGEEFEAFDVPMDERAGRTIEGLRFLDEFLSSDEPISVDCPFFSVEDWQSRSRDGIRGRRCGSAAGVTSRSPAR